MTAVARLFAYTLVLVTLGSSSACITTLCLSALCGDPQAQAEAQARFESARPSAIVPTEALAERSDHNCNLMRF